MFLEPLVACRKRLKRNWTFYNWAGPNFAPKISPLILAQTNNIYIYTHYKSRTSETSGRSNSSQKQWIHSIGLMKKSEISAMKSPGFLPSCLPSRHVASDGNLGAPRRASIFRVALWTLWLRSPSTACPKTRQLWALLGAYD